MLLYFPTVSLIVDVCCGSRRVRAEVYIEVVDDVR